MDNRPIGVFDSGLGGLTTVAELVKILPNENIIYFGDTGRVPYGPRSKETVKKYALQDINFLKSKDVKLIIAACGTASSVLSDSDILDVEYTGVIFPTAIEAFSQTKSKKIGVIGTTATIKSGAYNRALAKLDASIQVTTQACPLFVPLVENGFTNPDNEVTKLVARDYLYPLIQAGVDTLILGCTHYPIIHQIITNIMGDSVKLINSGQSAAQYSLSLLTDKGMLNYTKSIKSCKFYISDTVEEFEKNAMTILDVPLKGHIEKIDIELY